MRALLLGLNSLSEELAGFDDFEVVYNLEAGRFSGQDYRDLEPSVIISDAGSTWKRQLAVFSELRSDGEQIRALVLTGTPNEKQMLQALRVGVSGYIPKSYPTDQVANAARTVARGNTAFNREFSGGLLKRLAFVADGVTLLDEDTTSPMYWEDESGGDAAAPVKRGRGMEGVLTLREIEILRFVALGLKNGDIATELHISRGTVKTHVERIIGKLCVSDRTGAVVRALEVGILSMADISHLRGEATRAEKTRTGASRIVG